MLDYYMSLGRETEYTGPKHPEAYIFAIRKNPLEFALNKYPISKSDKTKSSQQKQSNQRQNINKV